MTDDREEAASALATARKEIEDTMSSEMGAVSAFHTHIHTHTYMRVHVHTTPILCTP